MTKVLVVEDDAFLSGAYHAKFTSVGFDLKQAKDGEEALEILKTFKPDVIILDLIMPVMDGFTTLEEIKKQDSLKDIPVIVASNLGQDSDIDRAMKLGAAECITKSNLSIKDLVDKIKSY